MAGKNGIIRLNVGGKVSSFLRFHHFHLFDLVAQAEKPFQTYF